LLAVKIWRWFWWRSILLCGPPCLADAFAGEIDAVGVMDEAVEDGVRVGRIADQVVPALDGRLAGDDGGAAAIALLDDFEQIVPRLGVERLEPPSRRG
jgi:hypothetical protein